MIAKFKLYSGSGIITSKDTCIYCLNLKEEIDLLTHNLSQLDLSHFRKLGWKTTSDLLIELDSLFLQIERQAVERNNLITHQIKTKEFDGPLHDQYHDIGEKIKGLVLEYCTLVSRLLGQVNAQQRKSSTDPIFAILEGVIGMSPKKKSINGYSGAYNEQLATVIYDAGVINQATVFRNRVIEHPQADYSLNLDGSMHGGVKVFAQATIKEELDEEKSYASSGIDWWAIQYMQGRSTKAPSLKEIDEKAVFMLHVEMHRNPKDMKIGEVVPAGEPFVSVKVVDTNHFRKYGGHMHVFNGTDEFFKMYNLDTKGDFMSPDIFAVHQSVYRLITVVFDIIEAEQRI